MLVTSTKTRSSRFRANLSFQWLTWPCKNNFRLSVQIFTQTYSWKMVTILCCSTVTSKWKACIRKQRQWLQMKAVMEPTTWVQRLMKAKLTVRNIILFSVKSSTHSHFSSSTAESEVGYSFDALIQRREVAARSWKAHILSPRLCT